MVSRRMLVIAALFIGMGAVLACRPAPPAPPPAAPAAPAAPAPTPAPPPAPGEPRYGGEMIAAMGFDMRFGSYEPGVQTSLDQLRVNNNVYNNLIKLDPRTFEVLPDLATKWEVSDDGRVWTFTLRRGVKWHDGKPFTADDVVYSLFRWRTTPGKAKGPRTACYRLFAEGEKKVDDYTVQVILKAPAVAILPCLANSYMGIVPRHVVEPLDQKGELMTFRNAVGTGPFKPKEHEVDLRHILVRNDDYWEKGLPYLDRIQLVVMTEIASQIAAMRVGRLHLNTLFPGWTKTDADIIKRDLGDKVVVEQTFPSIFYFMQFNLRKEPWNDLRIRRAIHLWLDRQKMVDLIAAGAGEVSPWYSLAWDWIFTVDQWLEFPGLNPKTKAQDREEARRLFQEATGGQRIKMPLLCRAIDIYCELAQEISSQLKELGIDVVIQSEEPRAGMEKWRRSDYEVIGGQRIAVEYEDPDVYNTAFYLKGASWNLGGYENPEMERLFQEERGLLDRAKRGEILRQMARIQAQDLYYVPLILPAQFHVWRAELKGWVAPLQAQPMNRYDRVWLAK